jgi:hypothetical protein
MHTHALLIFKGVGANAASVNVGHIIIKCSARLPAAGEQNGRLFSLSGGCMCFNVNLVAVAPRAISELTRTDNISTGATRK